MKEGESLLQTIHHSRNQHVNTQTLIMPLLKHGKITRILSKACSYEKQEKTHVSCIVLHEEEATYISSIVILKEKLKNFACIVLDLNEEKQDVLSI